MRQTTPTTSPQALEYVHSAWEGLIGIARRDVTPPIGTYSRNWGAAKHDVAESVHRPLSLTAMVLASREEDKQLVLLDADLCWWKSMHVFRRFQSRILQELQIEEADFIFALTHNHASPPLMDPEPDLPGNESLADWHEKIIQSAIAVVRDAMEVQKPGVLEWGSGKCTLAANRDLPDPIPGSDRYICGFNPTSAADDTLLVGRATDSSGNILATLVNYACHPTTLAWENKAISPDYVGMMRETVEGVTKAPCLFLLGVCGELAPRYQYVGDTSVPDGHGKQLGYAALSTLFGMNPPGTKLVYQQTVESGAPLAVWRPIERKINTKLASRLATIDLPLKDWPSAEELESQRLAATDRFSEERLRRKRDIRRTLGDGKTFPVSLSMWQIGDALLLGNCCESYSIAQQELRRQFADRSVICMNLINGSVGYLPPSELYDADIYAVWQTPFDRGCLELTLKNYQQQLHELLQQSNPA